MDLQHPTTKLEAACPGVVSCADVLVLVARVNLEVSVSLTQSRANLKQHVPRDDDDDGSAGWSRHICWVETAVLFLLDAPVTPIVLPIIHRGIEEKSPIANRIRSSQNEADGNFFVSGCITTYHVMAQHFLIEYTLSEFNYRYLNVAFSTHSAD